MKTSKLILACCLTVGIICIGLGEVSHATAAASSGQEELPLITIGSFTSPRTVFTLSTHFSVEMMRDVLAENFTVTYVELDSLLDPQFCEIDLFFVNAWEVVPSEEEVAAASQYVQRGGTLLVNAHGWSNLDYVDAWIEPFLLQSESVHLGGGIHIYEVPYSSDPIIDGPFGTVESFHQRYESIVHGLGGMTFDDAGVVPLAVTSDPKNAVLALVPRSANRAGQALIVTNFHVFHDEEDAAGGFMHTADSQKLFLNLAESSRQSSACVLEVVIDIKPGSDPNSINLGEHGNLPVAILGSFDLDVTQINPTSIMLGSAGLATRGKKEKLAFACDDVNNDGYTDLVAHFLVQELALDESTTSLTLIAEFFNGLKIIGIDSVRIVPPK